MLFYSDDCHGMGVNISVEYDIPHACRYTQLASYLLVFVTVDDDMT